MTNSEHRASNGERRLSFGTRAHDYDRYRPTFPSAAVTWGLGNTPMTVVELGAGTGQMTRVLAQAGHLVVAVEPHASMRDQLRAGLGSAADVLAGSAESIPLGAEAADAVVAAESYHWFDEQVALREIARVVRPAGMLMIVWLIPDEGVPWVKALTETLASTRSQRVAGIPTPQLGPWFTDVEEAAFPLFHPLDQARLVGLVDTFSSVALSPRRDKVLKDLASLARTHPDLAGRTTFDLPYIVRVIRAVKPSRDAT